MSLSLDWQVTNKRRRAAELSCCPWGAGTWSQSHSCASYRAAVWRLQDVSPPSLTVCPADCPMCLTGIRCKGFMAQPLSEPMFSHGKFTDLVWEFSGSTMSTREFTHPEGSFSRKEVAGQAQGRPLQYRAGPSWTTTEFVLYHRCAFLKLRQNPD